MLRRVIDARLAKADLDIRAGRMYGRSIPPKNMAASIETNPTKWRTGSPFDYQNQILLTLPWRISRCERDGFLREDVLGERGGCGVGGFPGHGPAPDPAEAVECLEAAFGAGRPKAQLPMLPPSARRAVVVHEAERRVTGKRDTGGISPLFHALELRFPGPLYHLVEPSLAFLHPRRVTLLGNFHTGVP